MASFAPSATGSTPARGRSTSSAGRRFWYAASGVLIVLSLVGLFGRHLNLSLEFKGGSEFTVSQAKTTSDVVGRNAVEGVDPTADAPSDQGRHRLGARADLEAEGRQQERRRS